MIMGSFIILDESKLIFVSFEKGCGGHSIARTLCSLPNVYWYSNKNNGIQPWNIASAKTNFFGSEGQDFLGKDFAQKLANCC